MATKHPTVHTATNSLEPVLDFLRNRLVKGFIVFEVFLFVGGYYVASMGARNTALGAHPSTHKALGAVMGALGIAFGLMFLVVFVGVVVSGIRNNVVSQREF